MQRHHRIMDALRRRVMVVLPNPEEINHYAALESNDPGYSLPMIYDCGVQLGLFKEADARYICLHIAKQSDSFSSVDITRAFRAIGDRTRFLPTSQREEAMKQFAIAFQSAETLNKFRPDGLMVILKGLMLMRSDESFHAEPMLPLKNFLFSYLSTRIAFLQPLEMGELFLMMSRVGSSCTALTPETIEIILTPCKALHESAGSLAAALARASRHCTIPSPLSEEFMDFAFESAKSAKCGGQHQVTILRALLVLETDFPQRFPPGRAAELLTVVRDSGMLNLEGPNIAMMFSVLARLKKGDDPLVDTVMEAVLPQLHTAKPLTLGSIVKNVAQLGIHMPSRLAEATNRRLLKFVENGEPMDTLIVCLQGASRCANSTVKSRKILMQIFTEIINERGDVMTMEDMAKFTRVFAHAFGVNRTRHAKDVSKGVLVSEISLEALEHILMRAMAMPRTPSWAVVEVMRNLAELGVDYEEMKPLAKSVLSDGSVDVSALQRLIRALQLANCRDVLLIRSIVDSARRSRNPGLMALANEVIADIEASQL